MTNTRARLRKYASGLFPASYMGLVTVAHFIPACKNRVRRGEKERQREAGGRDKAGIRYRVNGEGERERETLEDERRRRGASARRTRCVADLVLQSSDPNTFRLTLFGLFRLGRRRASNCPCKFQF